MFRPIDRPSSGAIQQYYTTDDQRLQLNTNTPHRITHYKTIAGDILQKSKPVQDRELSHIKCHIKIKIERYIMQG
jgi:hypothetical protein